jgi:PD-(D/E)XK nuclease superfamily protein
LQQEEGSVPEPSRELDAIARAAVGAALEVHRVLGPGFLELIVELKAADRLLPIHQAQVLSYLKATGHQLGLLINFHESLLKHGIKRIVLTAPH